MNETSNKEYFLPSLYLMPVITICAEKYIDVKRILMRAGLSPSILHSPNNPINYHTFTQVLNEGARVSGDDLFGFLVGKNVTANNVGALGNLITAQTCIANIYPVISYLFNTENRGARHDLQIVGNVAFHNVTYLLEDKINCDQVAQFTLVGYFNMFRHTLEDVWKPTRILLKTKHHIDTSRMEQFCGCPVITGADKNAIEFPANYIYQEIEKEKFHSREAKMELARILTECEDLNTLVANFIEFSLANKTFKKTDIAKRLGIHPRVFQECLHAKGLEYIDILKNVRKRKACDLLQHTHLSITDIAMQLGYSESRVFTTAFKNWMGITPLKWRKSHTKD